MITDVHDKLLSDLGISLIWSLLKTLYGRKYYSYFINKIFDKLKA